MMLKTPAKLSLFLFFFSLFINSQETNNTNLKDNSKLSDSLELLRMPPPPTDYRLLFDYDNAGNQTKRYLCVFGTSCSSRLANPIAKDLVAEELEEELNKESFNVITLHPNPVKDKLQIEFSFKEGVNLGSSINIFDVKGTLIEKVNFSSDYNTAVVDFSQKSSGIYFVHFHLSNNETITKKVIKL
ncbi:MAG: T9SS type A sorting domain-containing protein [Algicola sp.]|nr:T9SS type A sorting domain-containing protein [Algicola sp.]